MVGYCRQSIVRDHIREYDSLGRLAAATSPNGTRSSSLYDVLNRTLSEWVGTSSTDAKKVSEYEYDGDAESPVPVGVGDGHITTVRVFTGEAAGSSEEARVTVRTYDALARGRVMRIEGLTRRMKRSTTTISIDQPAGQHLCSIRERC